MKLYVRKSKNHSGLVEIVVGEKEYSQHVAVVYRNEFVQGFDEKMMSKLAYQFAASGEMLAALEAALFDVDINISHPKLTEQIRSAITLAKGPQA